MADVAFLIFKFTRKFTRFLKSTPVFLKNLMPILIIFVVNILPQYIEQFFRQTLPN